MRFSVLHHSESPGDDIPAAQVYAEVTEQVRVADDLGYDIAWVAEHHFSAAKGRAPEPLLFLVHLAAQTRRIKVGSAVLPAPFYQPLRLAEGVAMTDVLTGGRLACGISSGAVPDEMRVFGVAQEGKHERLRDALLWLRRAWSGEPVKHAAAWRSESGAVDGAAAEDMAVAIVPRPLQRPEEMVWIAASTHGAAQVAGELGYHLLLPSLRPVSSSAEHVATYRAALAAGHDPSSRCIQNTFHLVLHEDHAVAMRLAEPVIRRYYGRYTASGAVDPLADASLPAIMERINFVAGGPEAVAEQLARAATALGLTHIAFQGRLIGLSHREALHGLELTMERVAPLLASVTPNLTPLRP